MKEQVINLISSKLNIPENDIKNIQILNSLTNTNFKVETKNGAYVVRIPGKGTENIINRIDEKNNILIAQKLNLESTLLYFNVTNGIKISEFIKDALPLSPAIAKQPNNIKNISHILYKLHTSNVKMTSSFNVIEKIENYEKNSKALGKKFDYNYYNIKNRILNLYNIFKPLEKLCPCHNDLIPENILKSKDKLYLIDWEYAGINDFMWDIASCSLEWKMNKKQEILFLKHYFQASPTNQQVNKLILYKALQDFIWYIWAEIKIYSGENFLSYAKDRLENLNVNLSLLNNIK